MGQSAHSAASGMMMSEGVLNMLEGKADLQRDLKWLEERDN